MKLRAPQALTDKPEATDYGRVADHPLAILSMSALGLFATVDSSRFAPLRTARGFLGTWRRFVDSAGDKAKPSSVCSSRSPPLLACLHDFAHVSHRPNLENVAIRESRMLADELCCMIHVPRLKDKNAAE